MTTQNHILHAFLTARPGEWIPMPELAKAISQTGIGVAVHSRVADLRRLGMDIQNRKENGQDGVCHSFYRFTPKMPQDDLNRVQIPPEPEKPVLGHYTLQEWACLL